MWSSKLRRQAVKTVKDGSASFKNFLVGRSGKKRDKCLPSRADGSLSFQAPSHTAIVYLPCAMSTLRAKQRLIPLLMPSRLAQEDLWQLTSEQRTSKWMNV